MENQSDVSQTPPESSASQPSNLPSQPLPENKSHSSFLTSKLFLIILVLVILFAIVYAGIYLSLNSKLNQITKANPTPTIASQPSPTPVDETANWKKYTNKVYKFEFKYPPNFEFESDNLNSVTFSDTYVDQRIPGVLHLNFNQTIDASTLKKCGEFSTVGGYKCLTDPTKEEAINGIKVRKIYFMEGEGDSMGTFSYVVQTVDNPKLEFVRRVLGGGYERGIDQILSTFKFTP